MGVSVKPTLVPFEPNKSTALVTDASGVRFGIMLEEHYRDLLSDSGYSTLLKIYTFEKSA